MTTLGTVDRYPHQKRLFTIAVILAVLFWVSLALFLKAAAAHYLLTLGFEYVAASLAILIILAYLALLLRKARLVAYLRGNARITSYNVCYTKLLRSALGTSRNHAAARTCRHCARPVPPGNP